MKRIIVFLCFILLLVSMATAASAEEPDSVSATVNRGLVTISGKIGGGAGQIVNLTVRDPNGSNDYLNTCLTEAGGLFSVSYAMTNTAEGEYKVAIGTEGLANVAGTSFFHTAKSCDVTAVLEDGMVKINGTAGTDAGVMITIRITAPDGAAEYIGNVTSGSGGVFGLSYAFTNTQKGKYTVYAGASGTKTPAVCYFLAGVQADVKVKTDEQKIVTVEGTISAPEKPVSVRINDPKGNTEYLSGVFSEADGSFSLSYTMANTEKGRYTVSVSCGSLETPVTAEFVYGKGLQNLQLSNPSTSYTPVFESNHQEYSANVTYAIDSISVKAFAVDTAAAKILINGSQVASGTDSAPISLKVGLNTITVQVIEEDGRETSYNIHITRAQAPPPDLSGNANLSTLSLSSGALNEAFTAGVTEYTANVPNGTNNVTVIYTAADNTAAVAVSGGSSLHVGANTVTVTVTAQNGSVKVYTITVTRDPSNNAFLSSLMVSPGTIENFNSNTTSYSVQVEHVDSYIRVTPQAEDALAVIQVNGTVVASGGTINPIDLAYGSNTISIRVTAPDGVSEKTYAITVYRAYNLNLNALALRSSPNNGSINLSPSGTNSYSAGVDYSVNSVTVTPTAQATGTTVIRVNGNIVSSDSASQIISLNVGENTITVTLTAPDNTSKTYTIRVTRADLIDASLSSLTLSAGELVFNPSTTYYEVEVPNITGSITVTPTTADSNAAVIVNGQAAPGSVNLEFGNDNLITVRVTARDGTTTQNYTIRVNRPLSTDATLSALTISAGNLNPSFSPSVTNYTVNVDNSTSSITITPVANNPNYKQIQVNGTTVTSGSASSPISLPVGNKPITIRVWPQTYSTYKDYTVTFIRAGSDNANLSALSLSPGGLNESFSEAETAYTANVPNATTSMTVTTATAVSSASVEVIWNGEDISGNGEYASNLNVGSNVVQITVTAENGTQKTYTLTITRAQSDNANLSSLTLSTGNMSPEFSAGDTAYTSNMLNEISNVTVTTATADSSASVEVIWNGEDISGNDEYTSNLNVGSNVIQITVTAENGTQKIYTLTITRAGSSNANLKALDVQRWGLDSPFDKDDTSYATQVYIDTESLQITAVVDDANATVTVNGSDDFTVSLNLGAVSEEITVTVTAQDGTTKSYFITVNRSEEAEPKYNIYIDGNMYGGSITADATEG